MVWNGSDNESEDSIRFLQHRAARFGLFGGAIVLGFYVFRLIGTTFAEEGLALALTGSFNTHLCAGLVLIGLWLLLRGRPRAAGFVRNAETLGVLLAGAFSIWMGSYLPIYIRPELVTILALNLSLGSRAIYVPSTARRTILINTLLGVVVVTGAYFTYNQAPLSTVRMIAGFYGELTQQEVAFAHAADAFSWWVALTIVNAAASRVIYGLRRDVNAMRRLGQYQLEGLIGAGAMGEVYQASHAMLRRKTAVKLLPLDKTGERTLRRFEREVQLTARLSHPNTVTIFDYGRTPRGVFYYAMELLNGATLEKIVAEDGPMPPGRVLHVLEAACGALEEAHRMGLVHRDIKPANIMLCNQGGRFDVTKVVDYGLVKEVRQEGDLGVTQANTITGTPQYMAPEAIAKPEAVGYSADLYALGAVAYYLLTGKQVFEGRTIVEICGHHLHSTPVPPSQRTKVPIPDDVEQLILQCLFKSPADRPASAGEVAQQVRGCADFGTWTAQHAESWWAGREGSQESLAPLQGPAATIEVELRDRQRISPRAVG